MEGAGGDAAMQINAGVVRFGLPAADHQLAVLGRDGQVVLGKAGDGQGDAEGIGRQVFDVIGRIALGPLGGPFHQAFKLVEPQQIGMCP